MATRGQEIATIDMSLNDLQQLLNTTTVNNYVKPAASTVGIIWIIRALIIVLIALRSFLKVYVAPKFGRIDLKKKYGEYVALTNLLDPISQEFAKAFARLGHSLILITVRNEHTEKLISELQEILAGHGGKLKLIVKDLTQSDHEIYDFVTKELNDPEIKEKIGILVNNAGTDAEGPPNFLEYTQSFVLKIVHVHVIDFLMVTQAVLKIMVDNRKGLIVNVTTPRNCRPFPKSGFPRSMRQFVDEFTKLIGAEFSLFPGLKIEVLNPGSINTTGDKDSALDPTPAEYVDSAMNKIGRVQQTSGYWVHSLVETLFAFLPEFIHELLYSGYTSVIRVKPKKGYTPISSGV